MLSSLSLFHSGRNLYGSSCRLVPRSCHYISLFVLFVVPQVCSAWPEFSWNNDEHTEILVVLPEIDRQYVFDNSLNPVVFQPQDLTDFTGTTNAVLVTSRTVNFRFQVAGFMAYGGTFGPDYDFQGYEPVENLEIAVYRFIGVIIGLFVLKLAVPKLLPWLYSR